MKLKIIGIILIAIGFILPFGIKLINPTFVYALIPSTVLFWMGYLLILKQPTIDKAYVSYLKWATYAIWINIALTILFYFTVLIIYRMGVVSGLGFNFMMVFGFIVDPIKSIFDSIMPPPSYKQQDGSYVGYYSYIRSLLNHFFSLMLYCIFGVLAKIIKDGKITSVFSGSLKDRRAH